MRQIVLFLTWWALAGCSSLTVPRTVNVEVPTACIKALPPKVTINTDAELALMNQYDLEINIRADELALLDYSEKLTALALPCVAP